MTRTEAIAVQRICYELLTDHNSDGSSLLDALTTLADGAHRRLGHGWTPEQVATAWHTPPRLALHTVDVDTGDRL